RAMGIDLGLERFLTASDGSFQKRPKFFQSRLHKWQLLPRRATQKQKGAQNREKAQTKVVRRHHRIAKRRQDFHLKTAHQLCDQAQTIFIERWTNHRFRSTLHRVALPKGEAALRSRYSIACFFDPDLEAVIECLPSCQSPEQPALYPPISSGDYLRLKLQETMKQPAQVRS
ncbi:MAG: transposase, partial [Thermostichus sp. DRC_bins_24]